MSIGGHIGSKVLMRIIVQHPLCYNYVHTSHIDVPCTVTSSRWLHYYKLMTKIEMLNY